MAYAEKEDLNLSDQRLVELTENESALGSIDETLLALLLDESQSIVDGKLDPVMTVPFVSPTTIITTITAWIWAYRIYRHREVMEIPQSIKDDYERALMWLDQIVAGDIGIGGDEGQDEEVTSANVPAVMSDCNRGWR